MELLIFGASIPKKPLDFGFPVHYRGHFTDDIALNMPYAAAGVLVAPSKQDNLPNALVESLASGKLCVVFAFGGMRDLVEHGRKGGSLARPFNTDDLALGIIGCCGAMRPACRAKAIRSLGDLTAAENYLAYYLMIIGD